MERAPDLEKAREDVLGRLALRQTHLPPAEQVREVAPKIRVERGMSSSPARLRPQNHVDQAHVIAVIEGVETDVLVERPLVVGQRHFAAQPLPQPLGQIGDPFGDAHDVGVVVLDVGARMPHHEERRELVAEDPALELDPLGQERVAVAEARNRLGRFALVGGHDGHRHDVLVVYSKCT